MFNRYLTYYSPAIQFVILCGVSSMCLIAGQFVVSILFEKTAGVSLLSLTTLSDIPDDLGFKFKMLQPVSHLLSLFLPACLFAYLAYPRPFAYLGAEKKPVLPFLALAFILFLVAIPFVSTLEELSRKIPFFSPEGKDQNEVLYQAILKGSRVSDLVLNVFAVCLIPALAEEFFFRGCLQHVLLNWMRNYPYLAVFIVAVLFSAFHGQLSGFIPRVYLGLVLGLTFYFTGNIWYSVLIHFLNNFVIVLLSFLHQRGSLAYDINQNTLVPWILGVTCFLMTILVLFFFYRKRVLFVPAVMEQEDSENQYPGY